MKTEIAAIGAMAANFATLVILAVWKVVPWLRARSLFDALVPLVAIHAGRTVAMQLYSAQANGYAISNSVRDQIVWGDQLGALLAILTLVALWKWKDAVRPLAWTLVVATVLDLTNALIVGVREELLGRATDVSWMILVFYVPLLWVSIVLVAWLLAGRDRPAH